MTLNIINLKWIIFLIHTRHNDIIPMVEHQFQFKDVDNKSANKAGTEKENVLQI